MRTILFTNARDEESIVEWIAHHLNLGFDTVYVYDHKSVVPIQSLVDASNSRIQIERVELQVDNLKSVLIQKAIQHAKDKKYDWMLYLDADEFLYFKTHTSVSSFLEFYPNAHMIAINWLMFGSNYKTETPSGLLLENYTRSSDQFHDHVKTFARPMYIKSPHTPHSYKLTTSGHDRHWTKAKLDPKTPFQFSLSLPIEDADVFIAHYYYQSYDIYNKRKVNRNRDDMAATRSTFSVDDFHTLCNQVETLNMLKYIESNKEMITKIQPRQDLLTTTTTPKVKKPLKFIHITKTAGSSIEEEGKRKGILWGIKDKEYGFHHQYFPLKPAALRRKYDWFVVVRNPYDRVISEYYFLTYALKMKEKRSVEHFNKFIHTWMVNVKEEKENHKTFGHLGGDHFSPQWKYIDPTVTIHVLKFENLKVEFDALMKEYNLDVELSLHIHETQDKTLTVRDIDSENLQLIHDLYGKDFEMFGYERL